MIALASAAAASASATAFASAIAFASASAIVFASASAIDLASAAAALASAIAFATAAAASDLACSAAASWSLSDSSRASSMAFSAAIANFANLSNSSETVSSKRTSRRLSSVQANRSFRAVLRFLSSMNFLESWPPPENNFSMKVFVTGIMECRIFLKQAVLTTKTAMVTLGDGMGSVLDLASIEISDVDEGILRCSGNG